MINKYTALERLQLFKSVASFGVIKAALIEESKISGEMCENPDDQMIEEFAALIGFGKCENHGCDLWFNKERECFLELDGRKTCRMCCIEKGLTVEF